MSTSARASTRVAGAAAAPAQPFPRDVRSGAHMLVAGRDVACGGGEEVPEILDVYSDLVLGDAPGLAARRFPDAAAHPTAGGPSDEEYQGLLAVAGAIS